MNWYRYLNYYRDREVPVSGYHEDLCYQRQQTLFQILILGPTGMGCSRIVFYGCGCTSIMRDAEQRSQRLSTHEILALGLHSPPSS